MHRRRFLGFTVVSAAGLLVPSAGCVVARVLGCHVAGLVFQDIAPASLRRGQELAVRREQFEGQPCFRLLDARGRTVGFLPKVVIPIVEARPIHSARLSAVNAHAVPWKQAEVELIFTA